MLTILKGNIISAPAMGQLDVTPHGYLVAEDGIIDGVYATLPEKYAGAPVEDCGEDLILQSFADLHLHAPQYPMLGMGMDLPLLDWLTTYTYPNESRFADTDYARDVYHRLAKELVENGTTRVSMFSSFHTDATLVLMDELEKAGITGYVGKVGMDRNGIPGMMESSTDDAIREFDRWLENCHFEHIKPIVTPRFTPSCTNELMAHMGKAATEMKLPVQSHLSENKAEIAWVRELHPDCEQYWQTYDKYGLWNERTIMAHCVWSDEKERQAIRDAGVTVIHCPDSNQNVSSGFAPVRLMLNEGTKVALGSDIAGGDHLCMFDVITAAIRSSKAKGMIDDWKTPFLTVKEGWYLGTSAGSAFFGEQPGFAKGNPLHALVLRDDTLLDPRKMSTEDRLERAVYRRQKGALRTVWSAGRKIYSAE